MTVPEIAYGPVTVVLYAEADIPLSTDVEMLVRVSNHRDVENSRWFLGTTASLDIQFHDGPGDDYIVTVSVKDFRTVGGFVSADPKVHKFLRLLLVPDHAKLVFPGWDVFTAKFPRTAGLLALDGGTAAAKERYQDFQATRPEALACLLNLGAAMDRISLGAGKTPLDFIKSVCWDNTFAQDRFFGYADPTIIPLIRAAAADGEFAEETNCAEFHSGSTCSYKQTEFDYSNVQLTFHEGDRRTIEGIECVKIEPDMDLYKELVPHGLLEVVPNLSTHGLTNPLDVLILRWVDASESDEPAFDPGYDLGS